jgi:hypothetical protein
MLVQGKLQLLYADVDNDFDAYSVAVIINDVIVGAYVHVGCIYC